MRTILVLLMLTGICGTAFAQYSTGFENPPYNGSDTGVILTGQELWYLPVAGSSDLRVFTYLNNALGLPPHPTGGGDQFVGLRCPGGTAYGRGQRDDAGFAAGGKWTAAYDICCRYDGTLPATDNLGSFSTQDSATKRSFIQLNSWVDPNTGAAFRAKYNAFSSTGGAKDNLVAGPAWDNLLLNNWYRISTSFDFGTNKITEVSITDLHTGTTTTFQPTDWYMRGGANPTQGLPTGYRLFVGGGTAGNTVGYDNFVLAPPPPPEETVVPDAVTILKGTYNSGDLASFVADDDNFYVVAAQYDPTDPLAVINSTVRTIGHSAASSYTSGRLVVIEKCNTTQAKYRIRVNKAAGGFATLVDGVPTGFSEQTFDNALPGLVDDFIDAPNGNALSADIRAATGNRVAGFFKHSIELVNWVLTP